MSWITEKLTDAQWHAVLAAAADIAIVIVAAATVHFVSRRLIKGMVAYRVATGHPESVARVRTVGGMLSSATKYLLGFVLLVTILSQLGVDTRALLTAAGVFSLAIGLGARVFISDVIGGLFIILEDQFAVGERVTLGSNATVTPSPEPLRVESLGLRSTRFRDPDGRLVIVGNGSIASVVNHSRGPLEVHVDLVLKVGTTLDQIDRATTAAVAKLDPSPWQELPRFQKLLDPPDARIKVRILGVAHDEMKRAAEAELRNALYEPFLEHFPGDVLVVQAATGASPDAEAGQEARPK